MSNKLEHTLLAAPPATQGASSAPAPRVSYSNDYNSIPAIEKPLPVIPAPSNRHRFVELFAKAREEAKAAGNDSLTTEEVLAEIKQARVERK